MAIKTVVGCLCASLVFCGCATMHYEFVDGTDGSSMSMTDMVPWGMKRDKSATSAEYTWTPEGGGAWNTGGDADNTDGIQAIVVLEKLINMLYGIAALPKEQAPPTTE